MLEIPVVETPVSQVTSEHTYRILIMDTEAHVDLLKAVCKSVGHAVVPAYSLDEAFAFLNTVDHADVIICAAYLEDESMFEFLRRVKTTPIHQQSKIAILALEPGVSGTKTNSSIEKAAHLLGADAFIFMPSFDAERLIGEIQKLLPRIPSAEIDHCV